MSSTKEELNLESYFDNNNNIEKMSNLFCNDENDDKIINISKLDEDLYSNDKKSARIDKNKHLTRDSNSQLIEVNTNTLDNNSKIINISNLEFQVNFPNETQNKNENTNSNENANENAISDINANLNENANNQNQIHKTEEIKINEIKETKKEADEAFKVKKKSFFDKISFRLKMIILIISVLLVLLVFTFIILKITIR